MIHLHRVVNHHFGRYQWIDLLGITAKTHHRVTHSRQIHYRRHTGEILHQYPGWHESNLARRRLRRPVGQGANIVLGYRLSIDAAQQILQQDFERKGKV